MTRARPVAVVTGAGSGIGRHVARALLGTGYRVVVAGRRLRLLEETLGTGDGMAVQTDVTDPDGVDALFEQTVATMRRVDLLFNNAGRFGPLAPIEGYEIEDWRAVVDTNLTGSFLCARGAFRAMKDQRPQGGRIINNGSLSAHTPRPHAVAYTATKHAITGLTKAIALEGRPYGIACGQIDVGNAATDMTGSLTCGSLQADGSTAVEPTMDVEHVARGVVYMANLPLDANVQHLTVMASKMPFVGRG